MTSGEAALREMVDALERDPELRSRFGRVVYRAILDVAEADPNVPNPVERTGQLMSAKQAAALVGVGYRTILDAVSRGELPAFHGGRGGKRLLRRKDVEDWVTSRPVTSKPQAPPASEGLDELDRVLEAGRLRIVPPPVVAFHAVKDVIKTWVCAGSST
jgi:excisionase family DNA binding protein